MENKYLEKIAFSRGPQAAYDTFMRRTLKTVGRSAAKGSIIGAAAGGAIGATNSNKDKNGKTHRVRSAIDGAITGGVLGAVISTHSATKKINSRAMDAARKAHAKHSGFYSSAASAVNSVDDNLKHFGVSKSHFKTKAEASKHFKSKLHKAHPDKGGDAETFKKLNTARERILKSEWFEKLAMTNKYLATMAK